jgi:hypothetical protein
MTLDFSDWYRYSVPNTVAEQQQTFTPGARGSSFRRRGLRYRCGWLIGLMHDRGTGKATARCVELLLNAHRLSLVTEDGYIDCWLRHSDADMEEYDAVLLTH